MNRRGFGRVLMGAACFCLLSGCGKQEGTNSGASNVSQPSSTISDDENRRSDSPTADVAVAAVLRGLGKNDPHAVWEFLPESYQEDVNRVVHRFAQQMDAELWNQTFETASKIAEILKTKRAFIFEHPALKQAEPVAAEQMAANWDALVGLLATVLNSDVSDLEKLKTIDVGVFLADTGGRLWNQFSALSKLAPSDPFNAELHRLSETKIELMSSKRDWARVRFSPFDPKLPATEYEFVNVEGKWIPKTLAQGWKATIANIEAQIAGRLTPTAISALKKPILQRLDTFDMVADALLEAKTADEFNRVVNAQVLPQLGALIAMMRTYSPGGAAAEPLIPANGTKKSSSSGQETITLVIEGKLDAASEDRIINRLLDLVDDPDLGLAESPEVIGGTTRIKLSPVQDAAAFAKKIDFLKVHAVDVKARTIRVKKRMTNN